MAFFAGAVESAAPFAEGQAPGSMDTECVAGLGDKAAVAVGTGH